MNLFVLHRYESGLYSAPLTYDSSNKRPIAVTVQTGFLTEPKRLNITSITHLVAIPQPDKTIKYNYTVCIKAMHGPFSDYKGIVDFVESHRIFGAQKFYFYNYAATEEVWDYLREYQKRGIAEVVPWDLPGPVRLLI